MSIKVDWSLAPDDATHALTTGSKWDGAPSLKDKVRFVRMENGEYCDGYGSSSVFCSMDCYGWVVLEERPEHPQTNHTHPKQDRYKLDESTDYLDEFFSKSTPEEVRGAMSFTIGKYISRLGKKDDILKEVTKIADYSNRWMEYEKELLK